MRLVVPPKNDPHQRSVLVFVARCVRMGLVYSGGGNVNYIVTMIAIAQRLRSQKKQTDRDCYVFGKRARSSTSLKYRQTLFFLLGRGPQKLTCVCVCADVCIFDHILCVRKSLRGKYRSNTGRKGVRRTIAINTRSYILDHV